MKTDYYGKDEIAVDIGILVRTAERLTMFIGKATRLQKVAIRTVAEQILAVLDNA